MLKYIPLILFGLVAILNGFMDRFMMNWDLLPPINQNKINPNWFSFNPAAKWKDGKFNTTKANNIILAKLGIKTKLFTDNCNDGWHFFKSIIIILLALAIDIKNPILPYYSDIIIYGIIWNLLFNLTLKYSK